MIEIKFLGGAGEVGRSSFFVDSGVEKFLLDYGISVQQMAVPVQPTVNLDGVVLSHSHLDHIGIVPELYKRGYKGETFLTKTTQKLSELMLYDAIKVQDRRGLTPLFQTYDIETYMASAHPLEFKEKINLRNSTLELR